MTDSENDPAVALPRAVQLATTPGGQGAHHRLEPERRGHQPHLLRRRRQQRPGGPHPVRGLHLGLHQQPELQRHRRRHPVGPAQRGSLELPGHHGHQADGPGGGAPARGGEKQGDVNGDGQLQARGLRQRRELREGDRRRPEGQPERRSTPQAEFAQLLHPRDADPYSYDWQGDLAKLNEGKPDVIVGGDLPPAARGDRLGRQRHPARARACFTFTTCATSGPSSSRAPAGDKQEGVSHVLLERRRLGRGLPRGLRGGGGRPGRLPRRRLLRQRPDASCWPPSSPPSTSTRRPSPGRRCGTPCSRTSESGGRARGRAGAGRVRPGHRHVRAGRAINYDGASGPMDYDGNLNIRNRIAHFRIDGTRTVDLATFDCIRSDECPLRARLLQSLVIPLLIGVPLGLLRCGHGAPRPAHRDLPPAGARRSRAATRGPRRACWRPAFLHRTLAGGAVDAAAFLRRDPSRSRVRSCR